MYPLQIVTGNNVWALRRMEPSLDCVLEFTIMPALYFLCDWYLYLLLSWLLGLFYHSLCFFLHCVVDLQSPPFTTWIYFIAKFVVHPTSVLVPNHWGVNSILLLVIHYSTWLTWRGGSRWICEYQNIGEWLCATDAHKVTADACTSADVGLFMRYVMII